MAELDPPGDDMGASDATKSVYQRALGEDFASLEPRLQQYFGPIPPGFVGTGSGVYDVAGSRLRFLRPILDVMARRNVLFPELGHGVPFTIVNTPGADGSLSATRTFEFPHRTRIMEDTMTAADGRLVDRLGRRRGFEVTLRLTVVAGSLRMTSTSLAVRAGRMRIPLRPLAALHLDEHTDLADPARQRVDVRVIAPLLGEVFRYSGTFIYTVHPAAGSER